MAAAMIPPSRTHQKNDAADADAMGEADSRPRPRFVPVKSEGQPAVLTGHRARDRLVTEGRALANQIRGGLMAYGIILAQGIQRLRRAWPELTIAETLPEVVREVVGELRERVGEWVRRITDYEQRSAQVAKQNDAATRWMQVEGVGPLTATAHCGHRW